MKKWITDITVNGQRVGYLYANRLPVASVLDKALPTVFRQLSLRGHSERMSFKAHGERWTFEPDFLAQARSV